MWLPFHYVRRPWVGEEVGNTLSNPDGMVTADKNNDQRDNDMLSHLLLTSQHLLPELQDERGGKRVFAFFYENFSYDPGAPRFNLKV